MVSYIRAIKHQSYIKSFLRIQRKYKRIEKKLSSKVKRNQKIRIGFYVVYDSSWGARPLFEYLKNDERYSVSIVVCPDTARGKENEFTLLHTTYNRLSKLYGESYVFNSFDESKNSFIDYSDRFDIISFENPYDSMTHKFYKVRYLIKKGKLTIFNSYAYQGKLKYDEFFLMKSEEYSLFWKFFVDNQETVEHAKNNQIIKGMNIVLSGYCKMDKFKKSISEAKNKTILLAPHHTVENKGFLHISNFLNYADYFLNLPAQYPEINFIFRPHPLLIPTLKKDTVWGIEKTEAYLNKMCSYTNVYYSTDGEYFDDFNKSDAMIDDCGSFLAEYFYTEKPQCYMLKNQESLDNEFSAFGKEMFTSIYKAFSEKDIHNFIEKVVIQNNDELKAVRENFARNRIMINYPCVSKFIGDYIFTSIKDFS